jgi:hypothetical protein
MKQFMFTAFLCVRLPVFEIDKQNKRKRARIVICRVNFLAYFSLVRPV